MEEFVSAKVGIVVPRSAAGREFALVAAGGHDARRGEREERAARKRTDGGSARGALRGECRLWA